MTRLADPGASRCVYTVLMGGYEPLTEQPVRTRSNFRFICVTDDASLKSDTWEMQVVQPLLQMDSIRSQRDIKIRPHLYLTDIEASLYIDNRIVLKAPPEEIVARYDHQSGFALPHHSFHETVLDEFLEVSRLGMDDQTRIFEQLNHYALIDPEGLERRPAWSAILLRDHGEPKVEAMLEIWAAQVLRYSRRDQLSFTFAARRAGLVPGFFAIDNFGSWFHDWPMPPERKPDTGERPAAMSLRPLVARIRGLELELAAAREETARLRPKPDE